VGGSDVGKVERRVLAHQHDVGVAAQVQDPRLTGREMTAGLALHSDWSGHRPDPALGVAEVVDPIMIERVAARLRAQHQCESGIAGNVDRRERVHLDGDIQRHSTSFSSPRT
jgi:hypothetical protein